MKKHSEEYNQIFLVSFLRKLQIYNKANALPHFEFWHTPNGGMRSKVEAGRLKLMGVKAGVTDLIFMSPNQNVFFVELKDKKGVVSGAQKDFIRDAELFGFKCHVVFAANAREMIEKVGLMLLDKGLVNQNGISKASSEALGGWTE